MARKYERVCVSLPVELAKRLRSNYPAQSFSALIVQLLTYADQADFMKKIKVEHSAKQKAAQAAKLAEARQIIAAAEAVVSDEVEEFGL